MEAQRRSRRRGDLAPWLLLGFGAGLAAGLVVSEVFGAGGFPRLRRLLGALVPGGGAPTPAARAAEVLVALRADPDLAGQSIEVLATPRGLTLRGWVPSRAARARAYRLARTAVAAADGREAADIVNRLLVRGEDDIGPALVLDDEPRSA